MVRETRYLIVRNLPENCTEETIIVHFQRYGKIQSVKLQKDNDADNTATVAFNDIKSAAKAHNAKNSIGQVTLRTDYWEGSTGTPVLANTPVAGSSSVRSSTYSSASTPASRLVSTFPTWSKGTSDEDGSNTHDKVDISQASVAGINTFVTASAALDKLSSTAFDLQRGRGRERIKQKKFGQKFEKSGSFGRHGTTTSTRSLEAARSQSEAAAAAAAAVALSLSATPATTSASSSSSGNTSGLNPIIVSDSKDMSSRDLKESSRESACRSRPHSVASPSSRNSGVNRLNSHSRSVSHSRSRSRGSRSSSCRSRSSGTSQSTSPHRSHTSSTTRPQSMVGTSRLVNSEVKEAKRDDNDGDRRPLGICVTGLPMRSTDSSLRDGLYHEYKKHGKVTTVQICGDGESRCAVISFRKPEDASKALEASQGKVFFGAKVKVSSHEGVEVDDTDRGNEIDSLDEYHVKSTRTLFVGNLEKETTTQDLIDKFKQFGDIIDVDIKRQGASTAFAFVQYADIASVVSALRAMEGEHIGINKIKLGFGKSMPTSCVWMDCLPTDSNNRLLRTAMARYGEVTYCCVDRNRNKGLVYFTSYEDAQRCVNDIKMRPHIMKKKLQIDFASRECQTDFLDRMETSGQLRANERPDESRVHKFRQQRSFDSFQEDGSPSTYGFSRTSSSFTARNGRSSSGSTSYRRGRQCADGTFTEENHTGSRRSRRQEEFNQTGQFYSGKGSTDDYDAVLREYGHSQRERRERDVSPRPSVDRRVDSQSRQNSRDHSLDRYDKDRTVEIYNSRDTSPGSDRNSYHSGSRHRSSRDEKYSSREHYEDSKTEDNDHHIRVSRNTSPHIHSRSLSHDSDYEHRGGSRSQSPPTPIQEDSSIHRIYYSDDCKRSTEIIGDDYSTYSAAHKQKDLDEISKVKSLLIHSSKLGAEVIKTAGKCRKRTHEESGLSDLGKIDAKLLRKSDKSVLVSEKGKVLSEKEKKLNYEASRQVLKGRERASSPGSSGSHGDSENGSVSEGDLHHLHQEKHHILRKLRELNEEVVGTSEPDSPRSVAKVKSVAVKEALRLSGRSHEDRKGEEGIVKVDTHRRTGVKVRGLDSRRESRNHLSEDLNSVREDKSLIDEKEGSFGGHSDSDCGSGVRRTKKRRTDPSVDIVSVKDKGYRRAGSVDVSEDEDLDRKSDHSFRIHRSPVVKRVSCDSRVGPKLYSDPNKTVEVSSSDSGDLFKDGLSDQDLSVIKQTTKSVSKSNIFFPNRTWNERSPVVCFSPAYSEEHTQDSVTSGSLTEKSSKHLSSSPWQHSPPASPTGKDNSDGDYGYYKDFTIPGSTSPDDCLSDDSMGGDLLQPPPGEPSVEERIRAIDEMLNMTTSNKSSDPSLLISVLSNKDIANNNDNTALYSKFRIRKRETVLDGGNGRLLTERTTEPSVIMQQVLSKKSILDQDFKRLEQMSEIYDLGSATKELSSLLKSEVVSPKLIDLKGDLYLKPLLSPSLLSSSSSSIHPVTTSSSMLQPTITTSIAGSSSSFAVLSASVLTTSAVSAPVTTCSIHTSSRPAAVDNSKRPQGKCSENFEEVSDRHTVCTNSLTLKQDVNVVSSVPVFSNNSLSSLSLSLTGSLSLTSSLPLTSSLSPSLSSSIAGPVLAESTTSSVSQQSCKFFALPSSLPSSLLSTSASSTFSISVPSAIHPKTKLQQSVLISPYTSSLSPLSATQSTSGALVAAPFTQGPDKSQLTPTVGQEAPRLCSPSFTPENSRTPMSSHISGSRSPGVSTHTANKADPHKVNSEMDLKVNIFNEADSKTDELKPNSVTPDIESPISVQSETSSVASVPLSSIDSKANPHIDEKISVIPSIVSPNTPLHNSGLNSFLKGSDSVKTESLSPELVSEKTIGQIMVMGSDSANKKCIEAAEVLVSRKPELPPGVLTQTVLSLSGTDNLDKDLSYVTDISNSSKVQPGTCSSMTLNTDTHISPALKVVPASTTATPSSSIPTALLPRSSFDKSEKKTSAKLNTSHSKMSSGSAKSEALFAPDVKMEHTAKSNETKSDVRHHSAKGTPNKSNSGDKRSAKPAAKDSHEHKDLSSSKDNLDKRSESSTQDSVKKESNKTKDKRDQSKDNEKSKPKDKEETKKKGERKVSEKKVDKKNLAVKDEKKVEKKEDKKDRNSEKLKDSVKPVPAKHSKLETTGSKQDKKQKEKAKVVNSKDKERQGDKKSLTSLSCIAKIGPTPESKQESKLATKTDTKDPKCVKNDSTSKDSAAKDSAVKDSAVKDSAVKDPTVKDSVVKDSVVKPEKEIVKKAETAVRGEQKASKHKGDSKGAARAGSETKGDNKEVQSTTTSTKRISESSKPKKELENEGTKQNLVKQSDKLLKTKQRDEEKLKERRKLKEEKERQKEREEKEKEERDKQKEEREKREQEEKERKEKEEKERLKEEKERQKEKEREEKERKEREKEERERQKEKEREERERQKEKEREEKERKEKEKEERERQKEKEREEKERQKEREREEKERKDKEREERERQKEKEREERERQKEKEKEEKERQKEKEKEEKERQKEKEKEEKDRQKEKEKEERERQKEKEREEKEKLKEKEKEEKEKKEKEEKERIKKEKAEREKQKQKERDDKESQKEKEKLDKKSKEKEEKQKEKEKKEKEKKERKPEKKEKGKIVKDGKVKKEKEDRGKKEKDDKTKPDKVEKDKSNKEKEKADKDDKKKPAPKKPKRNELAALLEHNDMIQMSFTSMYDRVKTQRNREPDLQHKSEPATKSSFDKFKQNRKKNGSKIRSSLYSFDTSSDTSDDDPLSDLSEPEPIQKTEPVKEAKVKKTKQIKRPHVSSSSSSSCEEDDDALLRASKLKDKKTDKFSEIFSSDSEDDNFQPPSSKLKAMTKSKVKPVAKRRKNRDDSSDSMASRDDFVKPQAFSSVTDSLDDMDISEEEDIKTKRKKPKVKTSKSIEHEERDSSMESVTKKTLKLDTDSSLESLLPKKVPKVDTERNLTKKSKSDSKKTSKVHESKVVKDESKPAVSEKKKGKAESEKADNKVEISSKSEARKPKSKVESDKTAGKPKSKAESEKPKSKTEAQSKLDPEKSKSKVESENKAKGETVMGLDTEKHRPKDDEKHKTADDKVKPKDDEKHKTTEDKVKMKDDEKHKTTEDKVKLKDDEKHKAVDDKVKPKDDEKHKTTEDKVKPKDDEKHKAVDDKVKPKDDEKHKVSDDKVKLKDEEKHKVSDDKVKPKDDEKHKVSDDKVKPKDDEKHKATDDKVKPKDDEKHKVNEDKVKPKDEEKHKVSDDKVKPKDDDKHKVNEDKVKPKDDERHKATEDKVKSKDDDKYKVNDDKVKLKDDEKHKAADDKVKPKDDEKHKVSDDKVKPKDDEKHKAADDKVKPKDDEKHKATDDKVKPKDDERHKAADDKVKPKDDEKHKGADDKVKLKEDEKHKGADDKVKPKDDEKHKTADDKVKPKDDEKHKTGDDKVKPKDDEKHKATDDKVKSKDDEKHKTKNEERPKAKDEEKVRFRNDDKHKLKVDPGIKIEQEKTKSKTELENKSDAEKVKSKPETEPEKHLSKGEVGSKMDLDKPKAKAESGNKAEKARTSIEIESKSEIEKPRTKSDADSKHEEEKVKLKDKLFSDSKNKSLAERKKKNEDKEEPSLKKKKKKKYDPLIEEELVNSLITKVYDKVERDKKEKRKTKMSIFDSEPEDMLQSDTSSGILSGHDEKPSSREVDEMDADRSKEDKVDGSKDNIKPNKHVDTKLSIDEASLASKKKHKKKKDKKEEQKEPAVKTKELIKRNQVETKEKKKLELDLKPEKVPKNEDHSEDEHLKPPKKKKKKKEHGRDTDKEKEKPIKCGKSPQKKLDAEKSHTSGDEKECSHSSEDKSSSQIVDEFTSFWGHPKPILIPKRLKDSKKSDDEKSKHKDESKSESNSDRAEASDKVKEEPSYGKDEKLSGVDDKMLDMSPGLGKTPDSATTPKMESEANDDFVVPISEAETTVITEISSSVCESVSSIGGDSLIIQEETVSGEEMAIIPDETTVGSSIEIDDDDFPSLVIDEIPEKSEKKVVKKDKKLLKKQQDKERSDHMDEVIASVAMAFSSDDEDDQTSLLIESVRPDQELLLSDVINQELKYGSMMPSEHERKSGSIFSDILFPDKDKKDKFPNITSPIGGVQKVRDTKLASSPTKKESDKKKDIHKIFGPLDEETKKRDEELLKTLAVLCDPNVDKPVVIEDIKHEPTEEEIRQKEELEKKRVEEERKKAEEEEKTRREKEEQAMKEASDEAARAVESLLEFQSGYDQESVDMDDDLPPLFIEPADKEPPAETAPVSPIDSKSDIVSIFSSPIPDKVTTNLDDKLLEKKPDKKGPTDQADSKLDPFNLFATPVQTVTPPQVFTPPRNSAVAVREKTPEPITLISPQRQIPLSPQMHSPQRLQFPARPLQSPQHQTQSPQRPLMSPQIDMQSPQPLLQSPQRPPFMSKDTKIDNSFMVTGTDVLSIPLDIDVPKVQQPPRRISTGLTVQPILDQPLRQTQVSPRRKSQEFPSELLILSSRRKTEEATAASVTHLDRRFPPLLGSDMIFSKERTHINSLPPPVSISLDHAPHDSNSQSPMQSLTILPHQDSILLSPKKVSPGLQFKERTPDTPIFPPVPNKTTLPETLPHFPKGPIHDQMFVQYPKISPQDQIFSATKGPLSEFFKVNKNTTDPQTLLHSKNSTQEKPVQNKLPEPVLVPQKNPAQELLLQQAKGQQQHMLEHIPQHDKSLLMREPLFSPKVQAENPFNYPDQNIDFLLNSPPRNNLGFSSFPPCPETNIPPVTKQPDYSQDPLFIAVSEVSARPTDKDPSHPRRNEGFPASFYQEPVPGPKTHQETVTISLQQNFEDDKKGTRKRKRSNKKTTNEDRAAALAEQQAIEESVQANVDSIRKALNANQAKAAAEKASMVGTDKKKTLDAYDFEAHIGQDMGGNVGVLVADTVYPSYGETDAKPLRSRNERGRGRGYGTRRGRRGRGSISSVHDASDALQRTDPPNHPPSHFPSRVPGQDPLQSHLQQHFHRQQFPPSPQPQPAFQRQATTQANQVSRPLPHFYQHSHTSPMSSDNSSSLSAHDWQQKQVPHSYQHNQVQHQPLLQPQAKLPVSKGDVLSPESNRQDLDLSYGESELIINLDDQPSSTEGKENQYNLSSDGEERGLVPSPTTPTKSQRSTRARKQPDYKAIASGNVHTPVQSRPARSGGSPRGLGNGAQSPKNMSPRTRSTENMSSTPVVKLEKLEVGRTTRSRREAATGKVYGKDNVNEVVTPITSFEDQKIKTAIDDSRSVSKENIYEFVDNEHEQPLENSLRSVRARKKRASDNQSQDLQLQQPMPDYMPGSPTTSSSNSSLFVQEPRHPFETHVPEVKPAEDIIKPAIAVTLSNVDAIIEAVSKGNFGGSLEEDQSLEVPTPAVSEPELVPAPPPTRSSRRSTEIKKEAELKEKAEKTFIIAEPPRFEGKEGGRKGPTVPPLRIKVAHGMKVEKSEEKHYVIERSKTASEHDNPPLAFTVKLSDSGTATIKPAGATGNSTPSTPVSATGNKNPTFAPGEVYKNDNIHKKDNSLGLFSGLPQNEHQTNEQDLKFNIPNSQAQPWKTLDTITDETSTTRSIGAMHPKVAAKVQASQESQNITAQVQTSVPQSIQQYPPSSTPSSSMPSLSKSSPVTPATPQVLKHSWCSSLKQDAPQHQTSSSSSEQTLSSSYLPTYIQNVSQMPSTLSREPQIHQQPPQSVHQEIKQPPNAHSQPVLHPDRPGKLNKPLVIEINAADRGAPKLTVETQKHHQGPFGFPPHVPPAHSGQRAFIMPSEQPGGHHSNHFPNSSLLKSTPDSRPSKSPSIQPQPAPKIGPEVRTQTPPVTSGAMLYAGVVSGQPHSLSPTSASPEGQVIERIQNPIRQTDGSQVQPTISLHLPGSHHQDPTPRFIKDDVGQEGSAPMMGHNERTPSREMAMFQHIIEQQRLQQHLLMAEAARTAAAQEAARNSAPDPSRNIAANIAMRNALESSRNTPVTLEGGRKGPLPQPQPVSHGQPLNLTPQSDNRGGQTDSSRVTPKSTPPAPQSPFSMPYFDRKGDTGRLSATVPGSFMQPSPGGHREGLPPHLYPELSLANLTAHSPYMVGRLPIDPRIYSTGQQPPPHLMRDGVLPGSFSQAFPPGARFPVLEHPEAKKGDSGHPEQPAPHMLRSPSPIQRQLQADALRQQLTRMPCDLTTRDSPVGFLQRYPVMWQGALALKNDNSYVQMHFIAGNRRLPNQALPQPMQNGALPPLRISQRMRLEHAQLEGVAKRMQCEDHYCILIAVACGRDQMDINQQTRALNEGFITYLLSKQAAGIVNVPLPGSEQVRFVVHIFPPCEFVDNSVAQQGSVILMEQLREVPHAVIIIATT